MLQLSIQTNPKKTLHKSVLLKESIEALNIKPDGIYIDATFGRGGHSATILKGLGPQGRLIVFDQDLEAIKHAQMQLGQDRRVSIIPKNFEYLTTSLHELNIKKVDGLLFDLGVSSPQLDEAERGFSFLKAGPLDMRMNQNSGQNCTELLEHIDEHELTKILKIYGEERFAKQIAHAIVTQRATAPLITTTDLARLIENTIPKRFQERHKHPATRTFQALRIYLNRELEVLENTLDQVPDLLALHGRAVFISFHSLEDRLVKHKFQALSNPQKLPRGLPIKDEHLQLPHFALYIKMQKADEQETEENPRARSAVLRVVERIR